MKSAENQLYMLLLVTTLFLILLLPTYIRFIYSSLLEMDTPSKYASSMLFSQITHKLYITNNGINFFLYCISGKKFRNDLKEIVCCVGNPSVSKRNTITSSYSQAIQSWQFWTIWTQRFKTIHQTVNLSPVGVQPTTLTITGLIV